MWATYWDALYEVGGRRVLLVLFILGLVIGLLFDRSYRFDELNGVQVIYRGPISMGPLPFAVPVILEGLASVTGMFWIIVWLVAGGPLFVLTLERGWRELTFSKGTPRWQIFLGRYLATTTLFGIFALMSDMPLALRLWWHTGIPTWHIAIGVLIQTLSFMSLLAVAALASMTAQGGVAFPILAPISVLIVSSLISNRQGLYPDYISSKLVLRIVDWVYYILPKCDEVGRVASTFIQSHAISTSLPLWTTGLFTLATLALTMKVLERKSF